MNQKDNVEMDREPAAHDWYTLNILYPLGASFERITCSHLHHTTSVAAACTTEGSLPDLPHYKPVVEIRIRNTQEVVALYQGSNGILYAFVIKGEDEDTVYESEADPGVKAFIGEMRRVHGDKFKLLDQSGFR